MKNAYLFPNNKIGYDDYLRTIQDAVSKDFEPWNKERFEKGISSLLKIEDQERRQKMIDTSVWIDRLFTKEYSSSNSTVKKLPVIMTLANIMCNHYDKVHDLSIEQMVLLGDFSSIIRDVAMDSHLKVFGDKDLLDAVINKTIDRDERFDILGVVEDKYLQTGIDKSDFEIEKFKKEMTSVININSKEYLLGMVRPIEEISIELGQKH